MWKHATDHQDYHYQIGTGFFIHCSNSTIWIRDCSCYMHGHYFQVIKEEGVYHSIFLSYPILPPVHNSHSMRPSNQHKVNHGSIVRCHDQGLHTAWSSAEIQTADVGPEFDQNTLWIFSHSPSTCFNKEKDILVIIHYNCANLRTSHPRHHYGLYPRIRCLMDIYGKSSLLSRVNTVKIFPYEPWSTMLTNQVILAG